MKTTTIFSWILRIGIAIIFLQTLFFKFTAHPDSVHIFTELGVEPYGRIGVGIVELITSILLLINRTKIIGILLSLGVINGAIFSHFLVIGTNVKGDSGSLFVLAIIVFFASLILLFLHKIELFDLIKKILKK
jgi:putative oxidoreductase